MQLQGFHYSIDYGLVINTRRDGTDGWLLGSSSQLTSVHEVTGLRHCRGKVVSGSMQTQIFLKVQILYALTNEFPTQQRVRFGRFEISLRPRFTVKHAQALLKDC